MDLAAISADYTEVRGAPPYDSRLMVKILIYGYSQGSRPRGRWSGAAVMTSRSTFLTAQAADFVAISRYRTRYGKAFEELFVQPPCGAGSRTA